MIVIGFTGPGGAGKDTAAGFLRDHLLSLGLTVRTQAWANKLKVAAAAALGFEAACDQDAIDFCDRLKVHGKVGWSIHDQGKIPDAHLLTGREFLEKFGTEGGRDVYGEDHWIDLALPAPDTEEATRFEFVHGGNNQLVVIDTTTRFPNEAKRIRAWGGNIIRIERDERQYRAETKGHPSRWGLDGADIDALIVNDGSLDDLHDNVLVTYHNLQGAPTV